MALRPRPQTGALVVKPLTGLRGVEWSPTWSPDASLIAFSSTRFGNFDVFVMSSGGSDPLRLTNSPADDLTPRWSPDGRQIAFLSDPGTGANVYLISPLGGQPRRLADTKIPAVERFVEVKRALGASPWSSDSQELLFSRRQPGAQIAIWKVHVPSGRETQITSPPQERDDLYGSWSRDGKWILLERRLRGRGSIWLMPAGGGEPHALVEEAYENAEPAWSADGRRVLFSFHRSGFRNLWEIELASRRLRQLTTGAGRDDSPVVARGGQVAYSPWSHQTDIYRLGVQSGAEERVTSHSRDNFGPRLCPDGKSLLYWSDRTGNSEIWLLDVTTGAERQLTNHPAADILPECSPDGREIVFVSNREGNYHVWMITADGGSPRRVSRHDVPVTWGWGAVFLQWAPRWSPDGAAIAYRANSPQGVALWVADRDGGNARSRLTGVLGFDWYRDSRRVVYTRLAADGTREMVAADLETRQEALLQTGINVEMAVAPDGRSIAYCHAASHMNQNVYLLPLVQPNVTGGLPRAAGSPRQPTKGQGDWHAHGPAWSQDGKSLYFTRDIDQGDIYVIENYR